MFSWMYVPLTWPAEHTDKPKEFKCRMLHVSDKIDKCYHVFLIIFFIMIYIVKIHLTLFWYIDMIYMLEKPKGNHETELFETAITSIWYHLFSYFMKIIFNDLVSYNIKLYQMTWNLITWNDNVSAYDAIIIIILCNMIQYCFIWYCIICVAIHVNLLNVF